MLEREHALLNRVEAVTTADEREKLAEISAKNKFASTLLPIRTVGVQVSKHKTIKCYVAQY